MFEKTITNEKEAEDGPKKIGHSWVVVVAQLLEQSLPTPDVSGSNQVIDNLYLLSFVLKRRK